jgi:hypothetical protein
MESKFIPPVANATFILLPHSAEKVVTSGHFAEFGHDPAAQYCDEI